MKDFSSSVRLHESSSMSSLMRHLRRSVKVWQHKKKKKEKKKEVDSASRLLSILVKQFCTSLFITILGCLVEIKSMQDVDDSRM